MKKYYVDINGKTAGPFSLKELETLYLSGKIEDTFLYATDDSKDWLPLSFIIPLFNIKEEVQKTSVTSPSTTSQPTTVINNIITNNSVGSTPIYHFPFKSRSIYQVLAFFIGGLGIHNFYAGRNGVGAIQLLLLFIGLVFPILILGVWIWVIVEIFVVRKDGNGNPMI